ncbi:MAG: amino acid ABC transporter permease [Clostridiales bacterium]|nr:amino acid ABC transporter permease [Clostridiales bacterium]MDD6872711.1 amino acid ABC transporter permease [Clostridiales bacterium]MDD7366019.1 amino acid ABC transporter permease [Clostridiales bacterium]MDY2873114.1 amino acid ABC transporter permease [Eubacteriales bacterium]
MLEIAKTLMGGFYENIVIFFWTLALAIPLGLIITLGSMSRFSPLRWLTKTFVWIIRGTPLMLQLFVVLYAPGLLLDFPIRNRMMATLIAFVINYAAYFSEIYRGGIESIPQGQYEAGAVLGLTRAQTFFRVVLLQVVKRITPSMGNEVITLAKDTALARVIGVAEIIMVAERFTKQGLIGPLFSTGLYFLLFNGLLTVILSRIERKMDYFRC